MLQRNVTPLSEEPESEDLESEAAVMLSEPIIASYRGYFVEAPLVAAAETLRFLSRRLSEQAHLLSALSECKTPSEAMQAQFAFLKRAAHDYGSEARIVMRRMSDVVR
jgi:hypothetical protein